MSLSEKHLKEFKRIYKKNYGVELTDAEAHEQGMRLVNLINIAYNQTKENDVKKN